MKTKILLKLFIILVISGVSICNAKKKSKTTSIISIDMESNLTSTINGKDSIVNGINGYATYFSKKLGNSQIIKPENKLHISETWKNGDFSVEIWVQTTAKNNEFQVIASNKDWNSGEIKDFTDNRYFGFSRTSGINKGWAIVCQPDGSWAWNIGNGKYRKDYRPTAPRQKINEGEWHQIAFTINRADNEARLYFDGLNVAIYYMGPVINLDSNLPIALGTDPIADKDTPIFDGAIDEFQVYNHVLSANDIAKKYKQYVPSAKLPQVSTKKVEKLNLMSWNIWHGGRRHSRENGPLQVIDFIKETDTDIVMMQETYGSGPLIADALGYYFYLASANISVISKYPIEKTWVAYHELWSGITTIRLSEDQKINLASIWLHYLPDWRNDCEKPDATAEKLLAGEDKNRYREIKIILQKLGNDIQNTDEVPLIIGGDFNSPSHNDWIESTSGWHNDLVVKWPVSKAMKNAGFIDSFREIRPHLHYSSNTINSEKLSYRIDYIYYKGKNLQAVDSDMYFKYKGIWPSDHPSITTTFLIK